MVKTDFGRIPEIKTTITTNLDKIDGTLYIKEFLEPTPIIAFAGAGKLLQLWHCKLTGKKEWRPIPEIYEAIIMYECDVIA